MSVTLTITISNTEYYY